MIKQFIGKIIMLLPIQFFASELVIIRGVEFGSNIWWVCILSAGWLFYFGLMIVLGEL